MNSIGGNRFVTANKNSSFGYMLFCVLFHNKFCLLILCRERRDAMRDPYQMSTLASYSS